MFLNAVRAQKDLAGVFEYDGDVAYFYLYDLRLPDGKKIKDSIRIFVGGAEFSESEAQVRWSDNGERVGLFVRGRPLAIFDIAGSRKYGGGLTLSNAAPIPPEAAF
jgi:hypothetical protein